MKKGMIGGQFWAAYVPCESQHLNAVQLTLEQIDVIKRLIDKYSHHLKFATSATGQSVCRCGNMSAMKQGGGGGDKAGVTSPEVMYWEIASVKRSIGIHDFSIKIIKHDPKKVAEGPVSFVGQSFS